MWSHRESKAFALLLYWLREGNHTTDDIAELKEGCISEKCANYLIDVPHLSIQTFKVDKLKNRVNMAGSGDKYTTDKCIG